MEKEFTFTFTFKGRHAEEVNKLFSAAFWDGGFDEFFEQEFLEHYGMDLDDVDFDNNGAIINTDNAEC